MVVLNNLGDPKANAFDVELAKLMICEAPNLGSSSTFPLIYAWF